MIEPFRLSGGVTWSANRIRMDSSITASTLSASIKVRISGSDKALFRVNSCFAVLIICVSNPVVATIHRAYSKAK